MVYSAAIGLFIALVIQIPAVSALGRDAGNKSSTGKLAISLEQTLGVQHSLEKSKRPKV